MDEVREAGEQPEIPFKAGDAVKVVDGPFNNFNGIYLLTGGGPSMEGSEVAGATDILISYTYKIAFSAGQGNDYGLASAISIYIFLIIGTISAISFIRSEPALALVMAWVSSQP